MDNIGKLLWNYYKFRYLSRFSSRRQLEEWHNEKIQNFIKRIMSQSEFYRNHYAGLSIEEWREFPTIDKQMMMDHFDQLNTANIKKTEAFQMAFAAEESRDFSAQVGKYTVGLSSGTSGNRGLFVASPKERAIWAGAILAKTLPDGILCGERVAFFLRANSNLYQTIESHRIKFKFFDLLLDMVQHIDGVQAFAPTILVAPPSVLRILAEKAAAGRLRIAPKKIISVAEVLDPLDEKYIKEQFQQTIHQIYQCTEGFLATTCPYGTLHINEDIVCVQKEYIDPNSKRFIPVITDFTRTTQPIIRYRLNDILVEKNDCPCGSPFMAIASIEGRTDDVFYVKAKDKTGFITVFPDFIRREIIMTSSCIGEYKVDQLDTENIAICLRFKEFSPEGKIKRQLVENFRRLFEKMQGIAPQIIFLDELNKSGAHKLRRVERKFKIP